MSNLCPRPCFFLHLCCNAKMPCLMRISISNAKMSTKMSSPKLKPLL